MGDLADGAVNDARPRTLSWMAGLSVAAGERRGAEGYLLELLAWCAFGRDTGDARPVGSQGNE